MIFFVVDDDGAVTQREEVNFISKSVGESVILVRIVLCSRSYYLLELIKIT